MLHLLAYIDPGSGSLIIQAVIATAIAVPLFFRHQLARLMQAVRGHEQTGTPPEPTDHGA